MNETAPLTDAEKRVRVFFVSTAFVLLSVIIIALVYLATSTTTAATATLSFAGGVSNIFLPCTLPLAFVIVPLSMGMGYRKGLAMAILFGLGLVITLAFYGAAALALLVQGGFEALDVWRFRKACARKKGTRDERSFARFQILRHPLDGAGSSQSRGGVPDPAP